MGFRSKIIKIIGFAVVSKVIHFVYLKITTRLLIKNNKNEDELILALQKCFGDEVSGSRTFNKVMFFPDPGMTCARRMAGRTCRDPNCLAIHEYTSLATLVKMIGMAKHSVDICMYLFTSSALGDALVRCQENEVDVQVITDDRNSGEMPGISAACAQMGKLREAGIAVVCHTSTFWMHHKFMIIDEKVVATGSFNWTNGGAMGNFENCLITSDPELVQPYILEFDKLWMALQPTIFT